MRQTLSRMKLYLSLLLTICFSFLKAQYCEIENRFTQSDYFSLLEIDSITNVQYGTANDFLGTSQNLKMDLYFPKESVDELDKKPFILLIHGGGFYSGDRSHKKAECIKFAQNGFVTATISYRLDWDDTNPFGITKAIYRAQQDAEASLRFLTNHADDYGIDTSWMFIGGSSAGAITANNVVYSDQSEWNSIYLGIETDQGSIKTSGNTLTDQFTLKGVFNNWGAVPLRVVEPSELIPQIAFHGELDDVVGIDTLTGLMGSRSIHEVLEENGICSDLSVDPIGGHGIYIDLEGLVFRTQKTSCFFKNIMCDECSSIYTTDKVDPACTLLSSNELNTEIKVFPNPTSNLINFGETLKGNLTITSLDGKTIMEIKSFNANLLDVSNLAKGTYILQLSSQNSEYLMKVEKL